MARLLEILPRFATLGNSETDTNPLWVSQGENDTSIERLSEDVGW